MTSCYPWLCFENILIIHEYALNHVLALRAMLGMIGGNENGVIAHRSASGTYDSLPQLQDCMEMYGIWMGFGWVWCMMAHSLHSCTARAINCLDENSLSTTMKYRGQSTADTWPHTAKDWFGNKGILLGAQSLPLWIQMDIALVWKPLRFLGIASFMARNSMKCMNTVPWPCWSRWTFTTTVLVMLTGSLFTRSLAVQKPALVCP